LRASSSTCTPSTTNTPACKKSAHRYSQPEHARWAHPDPGNRTNSVDDHPYLYTGCNPTNYTDPTGCRALRD
jgi:RHS repeat-associated protein